MVRRRLTFAPQVMHIHDPYMVVYACDNVCTEIYSHSAGQTRIQTVMYTTDNVHIWSMLLVSHVIMYTTIQPLRGSVAHTRQVSCIQQ